MCLRAQAGLRPSCFVSFPLSLLGRFPSLFLVPLQILRRDAFSFFLFQSLAFARWRQRVMDSNPDIVIDVNFVLFNAPRIFSDVPSHCAFLRRSYYSIRIAATQSKGHIRRRFVQGRSKLPSLASGTWSQLLSRLFVCCTSSKSHFFLPSSFHPSLRRVVCPVYLFLPPSFPSFC